MRGVLVFTLVLVVGLGLLFYVERKGRIADEVAREGQEGPVEAVTPRIPIAERPDHDSIIEPELDDSGPAIRAGLSDGVSFERFDQVTGKLVLKFKAEDVQQVDDGKIFDLTCTGVEISQFQPEDGLLLRRVQAGKGIGGFELGNSFMLSLVGEGHIEMTDVVIDQERGMELTPFQITSPAIDAYLKPERFVTPGIEPVTLNGNGVSGEGRGLDFDGIKRRLEMRAGGWAKIRDEDDRTVRIDSAEGPLVIEPRPDGEAGELHILALGGAKMVTTGDLALSLEADEIELNAIELSPGLFRLLDAQARRNVVATRGSDVFRGQLAVAVFDRLGEPTSLDMSGEPEVDLTLEDDKGAPLEVRAFGQGPVNILLGDTSNSFEFQGPGQLESTSYDALVEFQERLSGGSLADKSQGTFEAFGEAAFRQGSSVLRSESLVANFYAGELKAADVLTTGQTIANGIDDESRPVEISAEQGLELNVVDRDWSIPDAREVRIVAKGQDGFQATAGRVQEFDYATRVFRASEGVGYLSGLGAASGEILESRSGQIRSLVGTEEEPASLLLFPAADRDLGLRSGSLRARNIEVHPDWAEARGGAHLGLIQGRRSVKANADFLRIDVSVEAADGSREIQVRADEVQRVDLSQPGQSIALQGELLEIKGLRLPRDDDSDDWLWLEKVKLAGGVLVTGEGDVSLDVDADEFELVTYLIGEEPGVRPEGEDLEFRWSGRGVRRLHYKFEGRDVSFAAQAAELVGRAREIASEDADWSVVSSYALGDVRAISKGQMKLDVEAERVEFFQDQQVEAAPKAGEFVRASGKLPGSNIDFKVKAERFESSLERLIAISVETELRTALLPIQAPGLLLGETGLGPLPSGMQPSFFKAARLEATPTRVDLYGGVEARGSDESGIPVSMRAALLTITGDFAESGKILDQVTSVQAQGPFTVVYGGLVRVTGDRLNVTDSRLKLEGSPAELQSADIVVESTHLELDLETFLIESDRGVARGVDPARPWSLEFASLNPRRVGDDTLMVMASPTYAELERTARSVWASGWVDTEAWQARGRQLLYGEPLPLDLVEEEAGPVRPAAPAKADLVQEAFTRLYEGTLSKYLDAALLEGEVEASVRGRRVARAQSIYMNLDGGRGWLRDVELTYDIAVSGRVQRLRTRAEEFVSTPQGALVAANATLTTCTHDVPHFTVRTGELSLEPRKDGRWRFSAVGNRVIFRHGIQLPLPPIRNVVLDESGDFEGFESEDGEVTTIDNIVLENTPRFGTAIGTRLAFDVGRLGKAIARLLNFDSKRTSGKWRTEGSWLSNRGPLLGVGLELRERSDEPTQREEYWLNAWIRGIPDDGEDRGLVRVDESDRGGFRNWFHVRGRYPLDDRQWIDVVFNTQNDAGVQSEFFQGRFISFEERENYIHWRKARNGNFVAARAEVRIDSFRSEVEELPSIITQLGRGPIAKLGPVPVLHTGTLDVANLRRRPGNPDFEPTFPGVLAAPIGPGDNRSVLRADSIQRLELGLGGEDFRATPFIEGRATAWEEGVERDEAPGRTALHAGVEISSTLLKSGRAGYHSLAPVARLRYELSHDLSGDAPIRFDNTEQSIDGDTIELGLRSIWRRPAAGDTLDIEVLWTGRQGRESGQDELDQLRVLGGFRTELAGVPVAVLHDGRYLTSDDRTTYSNSTFAIRPIDPLILEFGYQRGLDENFASLFELARLQASYVISPKWELSTVNWVSIRDQDSLRNEVVVRRKAHDFVLEMGIFHIAGEGGTGISFNFMPLLSYTQPRTGLLDRQ